MNTPRSFPPATEPLEARIAPALVYGITTANHLIAFDSATPGTLTLDVAITGLNAGEDVLGCDVRPQTGDLYILTDANRVGRLDVKTGAALNMITLAADPTDATSPFTTLDAGSQGMDFNPVVDRLRVVSTSGQNLRINVETGSVITDGTLNGAVTSLSGVAYINNFANATATTLFGTTVSPDSLYQVNPPNNGTTVLIGALGVDATGTTQFDIGSGGLGGILVFNVGGAATLHTIDIFSGAATVVGAIGSNLLLSGVSFALPGPETEGGKKVTFTDVDGDIVTVKTSRGVFGPGTILLSGGEAGMGAFVRLDLHGDTTFEGANITITAKPGLDGGDGKVNLGYLDARGIDLGKVSIDGDLALVDVGDDDATPAVKQLKAASMGVPGYASGAPERESNFLGSVGSITLAGDLKGVEWKFDPVPMVDSKIKSLFIGGSLLGTGDNESGFIDGTATIQKITIVHDVVGGSTAADPASFSGRLFLFGGVGAMIVGGDVIGDDNGGGGWQVTPIDGKGTLRVGGNITGMGNTQGSGLIQMPFASMKSIFIGGSIDGLNQTGTAGLSIGGAKSIVVQGDVRGGSIFSDGPIQKLTVGGDVVRGDGGLLASIGSNTRIDQLTIGGSVQGVPTDPVRIVVRGMDSPATVADALALGTVRVGGSVAFAFVGAGYSAGGTPANADVQIGSVTVGGDWIASSIAAGVNSADGFFGNANDTLAPGDNSADIDSRIGKIVIKGGVFGTPFAGPNASTTDFFGFVAQEIAKVTVGGRALPFTAGAGNDNIAAIDAAFRLGFTNDFAAHEIP